MMRNLVRRISEKYLDERDPTIREIKGLGSVNRVFEVKGVNTAYILRLNKNGNKRLEYQKECWCMEKVADLGIPTPSVLSVGVMEDTSFMILNKLSGINGKLCNGKEREIIWQKLGHYAALFQMINRIENKEVEKNEFHKSWESRLIYNLEQLNDSDSLLTLNFLTRGEQKKSCEVLASLRSCDFQVGLVHGDLSPRNVLLNAGMIYLLDWGTAEINVIPHTEIGIVRMEKEASEQEFQLFLSGMGISSRKYKELEREIDALNLLYRLDKYRWAESYAQDSLKEFAAKVKSTFDNLCNSL